MARAILLTFKDNSAAEAFVKATWRSQGDDGASLADVGELGLIVASASRIRWMIAQPTQACKCTIKPNTGGGKFNHRYEQWKKTERFGWLVHSKCNKPNFFVVRNFLRNLHVGYNNLLSELREVEDGTDVAHPAVDGVVHADPADNQEVATVPVGQAH
jgi:hypothetical protein